MTHKVIHPEGWLPAKGYANGMLAKDGPLSKLPVGKSKM